MILYFLSKFNFFFFQTQNSNFFVVNFKFTNKKQKSKKKRKQKLPNHSFVFDPSKKEKLLNFFFSYFHNFLIKNIKKKKMLKYVILITFISLSLFDASIKIAHSHPHLDLIGEENSIEHNERFHNYLTHFSQQTKIELLNKKNIFVCYSIYEISITLLSIFSSIFTLLIFFGLGLQLLVHLRLYAFEGIELLSCIFVINLLKWIFYDRSSTKKGIQKAQINNESTQKENEMTTEKTLSSIEMDDTIEKKEVKKVENDEEMEKDLLIENNDEYKSSPSISEENLSSPPLIEQSIPSPPPIFDSSSSIECAPPPPPIPPPPPFSTDGRPSLANSPCYNLPSFLARRVVQFTPKKKLKALNWKVLQPVNITGTFWENVNLF